MATEQGRGPIYNPDYGKQLTELPQLLEGPSLSAELYAVQDGVSVSTTLGDLLALPLFRNAYLYTSRSDAVGGVPLLLPTIQAVFVLEGGMLVVRERTSTAEDPLFPSGWGVTYRSISQADVDLVIAATAQAVQAAQDAKDAAAGAGAYAPYQTRAAAEAATVPSAVNRILVLSDAGSLAYVSDPQGTALTTADGRTWSPDGDATPEHWGALSSSDDATLPLLAAALWCQASRSRLVGRGRTYRTRRISVTYADWEDITLFGIDTDPASGDDYLLRVTGTFLKNDACLDFFNRGASTYRASGGASSSLIGCLVSISTRRRIHNKTSNLQWGLGEIGKIRNARGSFSIDLADPILWPTWPQNSVSTYQVESVISTSKIVIASPAQPPNTMVFDVTIRGVQTAITDYEGSTRVATLRVAVPGISAGDNISMDRSGSMSYARPGFAKLKNVNLKRDPQVVAQGGAEKGFVGLYVLLCDKPSIEGCSAKGFSEKGIYLSRNYHPDVSYLHIEGANRSYSSDGNLSDGTGYGLAMSGNRRSRVKGVVTKGCRKGVDLQGPNFSEIYSTVSDCDITGGGPTFDGRMFFPQGDTQTADPFPNGITVSAGGSCVGFGSHEGAFFITYRNMKCRDVATVMSLRGQMEECYNITMEGNVILPARVVFSAGTILSGIRYLNFNTLSGSRYYQPSDYVPQVGFMIWNNNSDGGGMQEDIPILVSDVVLPRLAGEFIRIDRAGRAPRVVYRNNMVNYMGSGSFAWVTSNAAATGPAPQDAGGNLVIS